MIFVLMYGANNLLEHHVLIHFHRRADLKDLDEE